MVQESNDIIEVGSMYELIESYDYILLREHHAVPGDIEDVIMFHFMARNNTLHKLMPGHPWFLLNIFYTENNKIVYPYFLIGEKIVSLCLEKSNFSKWFRKVI